MTSFQEAILRVVRCIPQGYVMSYGQIAAYIGAPRAARQVGWAMRNLEGVDFPWWRVLNNAGKITIKGNKFNDARLQQDLLVADGVRVTDYSLDISKYRFRPDTRLLARLTLDKAYAELLYKKYDIG